VSYLKEHPLAAVALGVVIGVVFGSQISRIPGISKLPRA
jgi:ElaB/YqjD/DUF883 family membrane-anchored ribosome-binding protein